MNIGQIKAAIKAAVSYGDGKRRGKRTALNDLSIHALEALDDSLGSENLEALGDSLDSENHEVSPKELSTILAQVGYIFVKRYPVQPNSPADHTWTHFLKEVATQNGTSDDKHPGVITTIQHTQRSMESAAVDPKFGNGADITITDLTPTLANQLQTHSDAQSLLTAMESALDAYYQQKKIRKNQSCYPCIRAIAQPINRRFSQQHPS